MTDDVACRNSNQNLDHKQLEITISQCMVFNFRTLTARDNLQIIPAIKSIQITRITRIQMQKPLRAGGEPTN